MLPVAINPFTTFILKGTLEACFSANSVRSKTSSEQEKLSGLCTFVFLKSLLFKIPQPASPVARRAKSPSDEDGFLQEC